MRFIVAILSLLLLCVGARPAGADDSVVFSLNWVPYGLHYGIFAAKERGFYKKVGLDVTIQRGYGSGDTVKRIGAGAADFGMADAASVIVGRGNGLKVKQIATILDRSADVIYYVKGRGIKQPKDLEGRTLGAAAGETSLNLLPVFAANSGFDSRKLQIIPMAPPNKIPSLIAGKIDTIVTFTTEEPAVINGANKAGLKIGRFLFSNYGVDYYSIGLIASDDTIRQKPDLVRRFVEATLKGYAWAIRNPEGAADAFEKNHPESSRDITLAQWRITMQHEVTPAAKEYGLGWIDPAKMAHTVELIRKYQKVEGEVKPEDVYTIKFLPKITVE